jgi:hypothetical protein
MANVGIEDPLKNEPNLQTAQEVDEFIQILNKH